MAPVWPPARGDHLEKDFKGRLIKFSKLTNNTGMKCKTLLKFGGGNREVWSGNPRIATELSNYRSRL